MNQEREVVSTQVVHCNQWSDEGVDAILIVFDDGEVQVRCEGTCDRCQYGSLVK